MSRIGKKPIAVPKDTTVKIEGNTVSMKGSKGELSCKVDPNIHVKFADNVIELTPKKESRDSGSVHGLFRALLANMVEGVHKGHTRTLEIQGVGYTAEATGKSLKLKLGYSHPIEHPLPKGVTATAAKLPNGFFNVVLSGVDKQLLGATAAKIRSFRAPEPYKGKGVRYLGEKVRRKEGKAGKTK